MLVNDLTADPMGKKVSASTRAQVSKSLLKELRDGIAETTGEEAQPLEQLIRVRPKTFLTIAALAGAFYFLLPQLANDALYGDDVRMPLGIGEA